MNFKEKKILFIGPKFHNYEIMIKDQLETMGASVDFFAERSYGFDFNIINNFFASSMRNFQAKHYNEIWNIAKNNKYDMLFVIRGYMLPISFMKDFKKKNPNSKAIMYQWDSQRTNAFEHLVSSFDVVKTFDFEDSENLKVEYVPLFYTNDIETNLDNSKVYDYDFFFMGFFFEERYEGVLKFKEFCIRNGYELKSFLYMPFSTRVKYFLKGKKLDRSIVSFKPMVRSQYLHILSKSRIMVDVSNPRQTGLAMRVIESLACNTKVATNNIYFEKDTIISSSGMVCLFDLNNISVQRDFLESKVSQNQKIALSLEEWLNKVFS
jgi:hypothetical protein